MTPEEIASLQSEYLADDLPIVDGMQAWTEADVRMYFESGGVQRPLAAAPMPSTSEGHQRVLVLKDEGNDLLKQGDADGAAAKYQQALELSEPSVDKSALYSNLALALLKVGKDGESLAAADACVASRDEWHKAHYRRGEALFALHRYSDAVSAYHSAQQRAPQDSEIKRAVRTAEEAAEGGVWFRQLLPGRDIALPPTARTDEERLIFGAAAQMKNFIYLGAGEPLCNAYMHTCVHACVHAYMRACIYACMHAYRHACIHACVRPCSWRRVFAHVLRRRCGVGSSRDRRLCHQVSKYK